MHYKLQLNRFLRIFYITAPVVLAAVAIWTVSVGVAGETVLVDRIVAVVNDEIIRLAELDEKAAPMERQIRSQEHSHEKERELIYEKRLEILNDMIDEKLADQQILQTGVTVASTEVDHAIAQIKSMNSFSDEELVQALSLSGLSMDAYREDIRKQILRNKLVNQKITSSIIITQSDIEAYRDAHPEVFGARKQYRLSNIMMQRESGADAKQGRSVYDRMTEVVEKLEAGESFSETAQRYSEGVNADDGGFLGWFGLNDLEENIAGAIASLEPGQISPIIETDYGYQIFFVEDIQEISSKTPDESASEIRRKLYEEQVNAKFQSWIENLRKEAHIKIMI
jgi:peptidyl-prolyl cis-trans isomerase SurA